MCARTVSTAILSRRYYFVDNLRNVIGVSPFRIMVLKLPRITDVPNMISDAILIGVFPVHAPAGSYFALANCLQHRAIAMPAASSVIDFAGSRILTVLPEHVYQVKRVDVVADLLSGIAENCVLLSCHCALY